MVRSHIPKKHTTILVLKINIIIKFFITTTTTICSARNRIIQFNFFWQLSISFQQHGFIRHVFQDNVNLIILIIAEPNKNNITSSNPYFFIIFLLYDQAFGVHQCNRFHTDRFLTYVLLAHILVRLLWRLTLFSRRLHRSFLSFDSCLPSPCSSASFKRKCSKPKLGIFGKNLEFDGCSLLQNILALGLRIFKEGWIADFHGI